MREDSITLYEINSIFDFGKYRGRTLEYVAKVNPKYIEWCLLNVDDFAINGITAKKIKEEIYPQFLSTQEAMRNMESKYNDWELNQERYSEEQNESSDDWDNDWNNDFYNDSLDTDQQSPEWWDSL